MVLWGAQWAVDTRATKDGVDLTKDMDMVLRVDGDLKEANGAAMEVREEIMDMVDFFLLMKKINKY